MKDEASDIQDSFDVMIMIAIGKRDLSSNRSVVAGDIFGAY
jgi:hypothetical protein